MNLELLVIIALGALLAGLAVFFQWWGPGPLL
jgi:hypothetical protein